MRFKLLLERLGSYTVFTDKDSTAFFVSFEHPFGGADFGSWDFRNFTTAWVESLNGGLGWLAHSPGEKRNR